MHLTCESDKNDSFLDVMSLYTVRRAADYGVFIVEATAVCIAFYCLVAH